MKETHRLKVKGWKKIQVQKMHRIPNKTDQKRPTPRHIIVKMSKVKDKERILKAARERQLPTRELP